MTPHILSRVPILGKFVDERFLEHRRRSTALGGIAGCLVAIALFEYRFFVDHVRLTFAAGNLCLSLGLLLRLFVHPAGQLQKDWLDGIVGLMMGVAIAINLASLYKAGKPV